jgi:hypothetical protein
LVCALSGLAVSLNALAPGWFFVGVSRPSGALLAEGAPRLAANLLAAGAVAVLPLWTYPVVLMLSTAGTLLLARALVGRPVGEGEPGVARPGHSAPVPRLSGSPALAAAARGADAGVLYLTGPLVAFVAAPAYPLYAAVDRLNTSIVNVLTPLTSGLVAWINEGGQPTRRRRVAASVALALVAGATAFVLLLVLTPVLLRYVFAGTVPVTGWLVVLASAGMVASWLAQALSMLLLVPQGLARSAYAIMLFGAAIALSSVCVTAIHWGGLGAIAAMAAAAFVVVGVQLAVGLGRLRREPVPSARVG